jgi:hypothetical protein
VAATVSAGPVGDDGGDKGTGSSVTRHCTTARTVSLGAKYTSSLVNMFRVAAAVQQSMTELNSAVSEEQKNSGCN